MSTTNVNYVLSIRDNFSKTLGGASNQLGGIKNLLAGFAPALGAGLVVAGFTDMIKTATRFEKSMSNVKALMRDISDKEFKQLQEQAKELGATTAFTASQAADGMTFLAQAGFDAQQVFDAMPATLSLASAGNMELAQTADLASNILSGYGFEANQLAAVSDVLAKTFTSSNTDLSMLAESFKEAAPIASSLGLEFTEVSAAIGILGNSGIQGSKAGTALKNAFTRLANPTKQIQGVLDKLGVSVNDSEGNMKSLTDIVRQLEESGASTSDIMTIFGRIAGGSMLKLVDEGADGIARFDQELQKADGTAKDIAEKRLDNLAGSITKLGSAWEGFTLSLEDGNGFISKSLRATIDDLTSGLQFMSSGTKMTADNFSFMGIVMKILAGSWKLVWTWIKLNIAAIKLILTPIRVLIRIVDRVGQALGLWSDETMSFISIFETFLSMIDKAPDAVDNFADTIIQAVDDMIDVFMSFADIIAGLFTFDLDLIKKGVGDAIDTIRRNFADAPELRQRLDVEGGGGSFVGGLTGRKTIADLAGGGAGGDTTTKKTTDLSKAGDLGANVSGAKGSKLTNINITIGKLVDQLNIRTTNLTEGAAQTREEISKALLIAVNDVNLIAE